ncbi:MAG TPA: hypothetical protein ENJ75_01690 [Candidatus Kaiserbacteria bacterium]|nr:hypothetical protein [Candidatus Kaiserbacteria bacterium]
MFVIDVIPFARFAPAGALSYRFKEYVRPGTIVSVPLRKKTVPGIVVACTSVRDAKESIKTAPFVLRSGAVTTTGALPKSYRIALTKTATHHLLPMGVILREMIPEAFLTHGFPKKLFAGAGHSLSFCEKTYTSRIEEYKKIISSAKGTVLIVVPTAVEIDRFADTFPSAIVVTGALTQKKRLASLKKIKDADIIITTPKYSFIPIPHLAHIIIERESANSYLTVARSPIDTRIAINALAHERSIQTTIGDYPLRMEIRPKPNSALKNISASPIKIFDVRKKITQAPFKALPAQILSTIKSTYEQHGRSAILAVRRGYASTVICRDCGTSVRTTDGRPLSLITVAGKRVFRSSNGDTVIDAKALCDKCGSWNLIPIGVGVERIAETIRNNFPNAPLVLFDTNTIRTPRDARGASTRFDIPGTIIVGTEALIPWLNPSDPISLAVVASADSLLALPFWRARERLARLSFSLTERAEKVAVVTRRPDDAIFTTLGNPLDNAFFEEEDSMRKQLNYPPYGHIVTIRIESSITKIEKDTALVQSILKPKTGIEIPDKFATQNKVVRTIVYKYIDIQNWSNEAQELSQKIYRLPPNITVRVDPESLW